MSTLQTINAGDLITDSRADINGNFSALNSDKIETSVLDTDTALAANSDAKVATQKAVKAYVDGVGVANASTTVRGVVEEATSAEVLAGTATGGTGARLFVNPSTLPKVTVQKFDASGTYTKPSGLTYAIVKAWGAGGSGASSTAVGDETGGGGGGGFAERIFLAASIGATETVTIGAGGATVTGNAEGNVGGNTTFGSLLTAYGGGGGARDASGAGGGGGGGALGAGGSTTGTSAGTAGDSLASAGGSAASPTPSNAYNGAGGGGVADGGVPPTGGASIWAGGGGGGAATGGAGAGGAGTGAGGAGNNSASGNATSGSQPGGGGGAKWSNAGSGNSGAGGDGRVIVIEFY